MPVEMFDFDSEASTWFAANSACGRAQGEPRGHFGSQRKLKALRKSFVGTLGFNLAGNEIAVWVELQLGHPHDPNDPAKHLSLRARLGYSWRAEFTVPRRYSFPVPLKNLKRIRLIAGDKAMAVPVS